MLEVDPEKRITATDALRNPWMQMHKATIAISDVDLRLSLNKLMNFRTYIVFQKAVLAYIASRQLSQKEEERIKKLFAFLDTNKDGQISKAELVAGFKASSNDHKKALRNVDKILENIELNKSGAIGYNGILFKL